MVVRGVANGILDALGLNYAANGQFMIHVALVSPICGRNAVQESHYGFRQTLANRRIALQIAEPEVMTSLRFFIPHLVPCIDVTVSRIL